MIEKNIQFIKEEINAICARLGYPPSKIIIVAVSKSRTAEQIKEVIRSGITDIGENRVQEAVVKYRPLSTVDYRLSTIRWHMVGHLQTNKVKEAVRIFDLIHSVDSLRLAQEIDKQASRINKIQDVLIEVNTSGEASKFGLRPDGVIAVLREISQFKNIHVKGLMTIAPMVDSPEKTRPCFRTLRELRDEVNKFGIWKLGFGVLSMGMTEDFKIAIEEGSNMVRLGRAIFSRQYVLETRRDPAS